MPAVRPAAVAGMFYPADAASLGGAVDRLLAAAAPAPRDRPGPKALIVPHAGYVYSGPIAASAYAQLAPIAAAIRRVVLLGPAHRVPFRGLALPGVERFATPLGEVAIDAQAVEAIRTLPQVVELRAAHAAEHSLEVQLPFLQRLLGDFRLLPLVVGAASADDVAAVLDRVWGGLETLILVSSDLSHYHPYPQAQRLDRATADAIVAMTPRIDHEEACGATPVNGLLRAARARGLVPTLIDLRNSGDTAGDRRSGVVGYGAFVFTDAPSPAAH